MPNNLKKLIVKSSEKVIFLKVTLLNKKIEIELI